MAQHQHPLGQGDMYSTHDQARDQLQAESAGQYYSVGQGSAFKRKRGRGRKSTSCIACNRRKQKCNSELPCLNCKTRGVADSCAYKASMSPPAMPQQSIRPALHSSGLPALTTSSTRLPEPPHVSGQPRSHSHFHPYPQGSSAASTHERERERRDDHERREGYDRHPQPHSRPSFMQPQHDQFPPRNSDFIPSTSYSHRPPPIHSPSFGHPSRPTLPPPKPSYEKRQSTSSLEDDGHFAPLGRMWDRDGASLTLPKLRLGGDRAEAQPPSQEDSQRQRNGPLPPQRVEVLDDSPSFDRSLRPFRDELGGGNQLWELLALLPRKRANADLLVRAYLEQYNYHADVVFEPEFAKKYEVFWSGSFHHDALGRIDMRWLALLFITFAFGVLLGLPRDATAAERKGRQESSWTWYWACRRCMTMAPTFSGESMDSVRAGILIKTSRYLLHHRCFSEAWSANSAACRSAQAQGYNIDGTHWGLALDQAELRRRLYSHLFSLDRALCLALRRPCAVVVQQSLTKPPHNLHDDEISLALPSTARPVGEPTRAAYLILRGALSRILGDIKERCYGLSPPTYEVVLELDNALTSWATSLPEHYRFKEPSVSWDGALPFLRPHRRSLHSEFYFGVVSLHRPFLLRSMASETYARSREACLEVASADLALRTSLSEAHPADAFQLALGTLGFASSVILALIAVYEPRSIEAARITDNLLAYIRSVDGASRLDVALQQELAVLRKLLDHARARRASKSTLKEGDDEDELATPPDRASARSEPPSASEKSPEPPRSAHSETAMRAAGAHAAIYDVHVPPSLFSTGNAAGTYAISLAPWESQNRSSLLVLPEASNLTAWDTLLDRIMLQME